MWHHDFKRKDTYLPVPREGSDVDEREDIYRRPPTKWRIIATILGVLLTGSLSLNTMLLYQRLAEPWNLYTKLPSRIAGLSRDVSITILREPEYQSMNRTLQNAAWDKPSLDSYSLYVALDDDFVKSHGLPHSQRWPWDHSKGVYILTAAHEIHCVNVVRSVLNDQHDNVPEAQRDWQYEHAVHCLNALRQSAICNADDYPMYVGQLHANRHVQHPFAGNGMTKQCRNWDALMDWAHKHSACYSGLHPGDQSINELDRYKFCPDGSRPWESQAV